MAWHAHAPPGTARRCVWHPPPASRQMALNRCPMVRHGQALVACTVAVLADPWPEGHLCGYRFLKCFRKFSVQFHIHQNVIGCLKSYSVSGYLIYRSPTAKRNAWRRIFSCKPCGYSLEYYLFDSITLIHGKSFGRHCGGVVSPENLPRPSGVSFFSK